MNKTFERIVQYFEKELGLQNVKQLSPNKFLLDTHLMLIDNFDILPVFLVDVDGECYLADYGKTLESLEIDFDELMPKRKDLISSVIDNLGVEFDGSGLTLKVNEGKEKLSLSLFTMAIGFLQSINI